MAVHIVRLGSPLLPDEGTRIGTVRRAACPRAEFATQNWYDVWVHCEIGEPAFVWQEGYGAFTVSATSCDKVRQYIAIQEAHHEATSFRDELVAILKKATVEFDPKYLD